MPLAPITTLTPTDLAEATWEDLRPLYQELVDRPVDATSVDGWLAEWSRLEEVVTEAAAVAMIAYTCDTTDSAKEATHLRFSAEILPRVEELEVELAKKLLALGYSAPGLEVTIARFRTAAELFREENIPLSTEIEEHSARYQKLTGGLTVLWDGVEKTLPELQPYLQATNRTVRERAFRLSTGAYLARQDELAGIFDTLFDLRIRMAKNAGFADYESYAPSSQPGGDGSYSLPMQMELEVNASTNSNGTPTVTFSYQDGFGWQTYDTLSFIAYSRVSPADVSFVVNGARFNPDGSFENAELILGGEYNGLNTTAVASEVGLQLQFWNGHNYQEVYNAYNFGGDTAEGIDNVKVGTSADPNGSLGAEVTTGSGTLGRLYSQSQVSFLAVSVPFESGVMYVRTVSSSQAPTGIYPFRGDSVNVTLLPGTYVANLISSDGILTKNLTETLRAGQALQVNVTSVTTTSTSVSSSQRTSTSSFTSLQTSSASSTSSTQATATESSSSPQGNQLELVGVTLVVVVAVAALYFMAAKRRGGRPQPPA